MSTLAPSADMCVPSGEELHLYSVLQVDASVSAAAQGSDSTTAAASAAVLCASRRLLAAALQSPGGGACAFAMWSLQGGAATAWLLSSLHASQGRLHNVLLTSVQCMQHHSPRHCSDA